jgi:hypothetical protein
MKKVLFLTILPFLLLGTASVSAQVRIGGSGTPHRAAVLDLNADNETTPTGNKGGLALPRVALTANNMSLNGEAPVNGMLVYHTGSTLEGAGVYVWMTDKWVKTSTAASTYTGSNSIVLDGDSLVRSALTGDVTAGENSNETIIADDAVTSAKIMDGTIIGLDIAPNEIQTAHLVDSAVTGRKIDPMGAVSGNTLTFDGQTWAPVAPPGSMGVHGGGRYVSISRPDGGAFNFLPGFKYVPIACKPASRLEEFYIQTEGMIANNRVDFAYQADHAVVATDGKIICDDLEGCICIFLTF